jgi:vacuolar protein sorting-associated protein 45
MLEHQDFSRAQGNITKHVSIMSELSDVVQKRNLMDISTVSGQQSSIVHAMDQATTSCSGRMSKAAQHL